MGADDDRLQQRIANAGKIIADAAKRYAGWSRHIPDNIGTQDAPGSAIYIVATGGQARAFEIPLRHPLNYKYQRKHHEMARTPWRPFLSRAASGETLDDAAQEIARVVDDWLEDDGWDDL